MPRAHVPLPPQWQRVAGFYGAILCIGLMVGLAATGLHATLDALESARNWFSAPHRALGPLPGWGLSALCGAAMTCLALALVRGFAPDTGGSGIPQVVAALRGTADLNWRRVLPVKFIAGILGIGSGMVLGREGPTIHLGGALGAMFADLGLIARRDRLVAIAAGAGAGLAAAFNAPLAGIIFVTEEMRQEFDFSFRAIQSVVLACIAATLVSDQIFGFGPEFGHVLKALSFPPPQTAALLLMLPLGLIIGAMGIVLNGRHRASRGGVLGAAGAASLYLGRADWRARGRAGGACPAARRRGRSGD